MPTGHSGSDAGLIVSDVLDAYLREHANVKAANPERQEYGARHLRTHLGKTPIFQIDIPACRAYASSRRDEGAAPATVRRELNIMTAAANHARKWKRITAEQMPQVELPDVPASEQILWLTKEQVGRMFKARTTGHFACFLRIAYYTAARRRSVQNLLKSQVNRDACVIHLATPGKKRTKKRQPSVPLYPEIRPAIDWLFDNSGTPYLFGRARDFYKPFSNLCEELQIEAHPHMLRHSRATHMLQDGENPFKVAKLLGDTVATVERVYAHCSVSFLATSSGVEEAVT